MRYITLLIAGIFALNSAIADQPFNGLVVRPDG
jgi:hypothetical protein